MIATVPAGRGGAGSLRGLHLTLAAGVVAVGLMGAADHVPAGPLAEVPPPVRGLVAALEDEVHELSGGHIAWATYWRLCWDAYPNAAAYELKALTVEGAPARLRRQADRCLRLRVASGENEKGQGFRNRELLLTLQRGQLAYHVRAILEGNRVTAWSRAAEVGETVSGESRPWLGSRHSAGRPPTTHDVK